MKKMRGLQTPNTECARIETPKVPKEVKCGERVSSSPQEEGLEMGLCPFLEIFKKFFIK